MGASKIKKLEIMLQPLNNFMIRLGYLKILTFIASKKQHYELLERKIRNLFFQTIRINLNEEVSIKNYIANKKLYFSGRKRKGRYSDISLVESDTAEIYFKTQPEEKIHNYPVNILDLLLSDNNLYSHLGAISEETINEVVNWSVYFGILKEGWYEPTLDAKIIKNLSDDKDFQVFSHKNEELSFYRKHNPFVLKNEKYYLCQKVIENDFLLFQKLLPDLIELKKFSRIEAGMMYKDALVKIYDEISEIPSRYLFEKKKIIRNTIKTIDEEYRNKSKRFMVGIQRISPRLENLVDLKLLINTNKCSYDYQINNNLVNLSKVILNYDTSQEFVEMNFWNLMNQIYSLNKQYSLDEDLFVPYLIQAYSNHRRPFGDTKIAPILSESMLQYTLNTNYYVEIKDVEEFIVALKEKYPDQIHLSVGKVKGKKEFISIKNQLLQKYSSV